MGRRSEHSLEHIKTMAMEAAEKIVAEEGVEALSTRKIAKKIGYTSGSLYMVFNNLDDLILHVNGRALDKIAAAIVAGRANAAHPRQAVKQMCLAYVKFASANPGLWVLVFEHRWKAGFARPAWYQAKKMACLQPLEESLRRLAPKRAQEEISVAAAALWGAMYGVCALHTSGKLEAAVTLPVPKLAEFQAENFLKGFLAN